MMREVFLMMLGVMLTSWCTGQRIQTVEVGNSRYFISNVSPYSPTLNWFLAYEYCRNIGMELLSLEQSEETSDINTFLTENSYISTDYWTSGNQLGSAMWLWMSTGQPFNSTFNNWAAGGPPLTKSQQSCMSTQDTTWSPHNCMDSKAFICEQTRCFYYNYVTTNRVSSQGNTTVLPGITRITNRPQPIRGTIQSQAGASQTIRQKENEQTFLSSSTEGVDKDNQASNTVVTSETPASTTTPTESTSLDDEFTTTNPLDDPKTVPNIDQIETIASTPLPKPVKVMPIVLPSIDDPSTDAQNNEIIPTERDFSLHLLLPPTKEFSFIEAKPSTTSVPPSLNIMEILSRKETFSWALTDGKSDPSSEV
ncbi:uncharacterized protein [Palaemon carinicauda]|uniref:uncharacterized protein n=1 Tax=Palaemon carinicauda TaxID=392227 RepID=UPI0035B676EC